MLMIREVGSTELRQRLRNHGVPEQAVEHILRYREDYGDTDLDDLVELLGDILV